MLAGNFANAASVYTETGVLTVGGTAHTGRAEIEGFFAAFAPGCTNVGYTITSEGTDTYSGVYDFGAAGQFDYVINLAPGTADIVSEVVTPVSATVAMMNLWQTEMLAGNFANAASVYTETGVLTVVGTAHTGRAEIEGFFAAFAPGCTNVGYTITSEGTDTYSGVYDFGAAGQFDYVINLAPGTADIVSEVVTPVSPQPEPEPAASLSRTQSSVLDLAEVFKQHDTDGNGSLDNDEFKRVMASLQITDVTPEEMVNVWNEIDSNKNGT